MELSKIDIRKGDEEWNNFIQSKTDFIVPNSFIGHNLNLAEIFEDVFHYKSEYYRIIEDGNLVGLLPGFRINKKFVSVPIFPSAGIFTGKNLSHKTALYESINHLLGKYEIRDTVKFSRYCYDKKVLCYTPLKGNPDFQFSGLNAKVRNQIKKGISNGVRIKFGSKEFLDDFYDVYSRNMNRLGSPVLNKNFFRSLLENYKNGSAKIFVAFYDDRIVGASFILTFNHLLEVGWASSLSDYNKYNINMVLYWEMMVYAIENGMKNFSFGRATRGSGSHKFKLQWGVSEIPLYFNFSNHTMDIRQLKIFSNIWKMMPLNMTNKIGPIVRKFTKI